MPLIARFGKRYRGFGYRYEVYQYPSHYEIWDNLHYKFAAICKTFSKMRDAAEFVLRRDKEE